MESATKRVLNEAELNRIAEKAFPERTLTGADELTDGWANTAYLLALSDGTKAVLKVASPGSSLMRYERGIMSVEVKVLRLLETQGFTLSPRVLWHDAPGEVIGAECFVMTFIPGRSLDKVKANLPDETKTSFARQLGAYNRQINEIRGEAFGYFGRPAPQGTSWRSVFTEMLNGVLADAADAGLKLPAAEEEIREAVERAAYSLEEVTEPRLVLWDLWDGNVMVEDGRITGLIDFERALWGDPLFEFYLKSTYDSTAFCEGYGLAPLTGTERVRRRLYDLYNDLILWIECAYRQYADAEHVDWAWRNAVEGWERFRSRTV